MKGLGMGSTLSKEELFKEYKVFRIKSGSKVEFSDWLKDELILARLELAKLREVYRFPWMMKK
jgi:hypothetical protein